jgi:pimeloyl-ACP methyl ester carboxylesterase
MKSIYKTPDGQRQIEDQYRDFLKQWPERNRQIHVPTSQGDTFVIASGEEDKPPLVLLHGALANSLTWMGDIAALTRSFRVYAVDLIGEPGLSAPSRPSLHSGTYASWLSDVAGGLGLDRFSLAGVSFGGWVALDYATRHPEFVDRLVLICPGGVGRQKTGILFKILLLSLFGAWGRRKLREAILVRVPQDVSPAIQKFWDYFALIQKNVKPRRDRLPVFTDHDLRKLNMSVLAIVGGKDALFDSFETRQRIEALPEAKVVLYPDTGHFIINQGEMIHRFLATGSVTVATSPIHETEDT